MNAEEQNEFIDSAIDKLETYKELIAESKIFIELGSLNTERSVGAVQEGISYNTVIDITVKSV